MRVGAAAGGAIGAHGRAGPQGGGSGGRLQQMADGRQMHRWQGLPVPAGLTSCGMGWHGPDVLLPPGAGCCSCSGVRCGLCAAPLGRGFLRWLACMRLCMGDADHSWGPRRSQLQNQRGLHMVQAAEARGRAFRDCSPPGRQRAAGLHCDRQTCAVVARTQCSGLLDLHTARFQTYILHVCCNR